MALHQKKGSRFGVTFVFEDESGYSERPTVRRTWAPKGCTPVIQSTGSWKTRTALGMISSTPAGRNPRFFLKIKKGAAGSKDMLGILKHIRRHIKKRIFLLWDGLPAHRSKAVKKFLRANKVWLSVFRFPAYAPELNPVEYLWSASKSKDFANFCPKTTEELEQKIRRSGQRIRRNPDFLKGFLKKSGLFYS